MNTSKAVPSFQIVFLAQARTKMADLKELRQEKLSFFPKTPFKRDFIRDCQNSFSSQSRKRTNNLKFIFVKNKIL